MTEKEKYFKEAIELAEKCGLSPSAVSMNDIEINYEFYLKVIQVMTDEDLMSHYKDSLEEQKYEQCTLIKLECERRNIKVIIK